MKCAVEMAKELMVVREQMAIEKAREEREKAMKLANMDKCAVKFCETVISDAMQEAIKNGRSTCSVFVGKLYPEIDFPNAVYTIHKNGHHYASGEASQCCYGDPMRLATIKKYLQDNCFEVKITDYTYMRYMCGAQWGYEIRVSLPNSVPCL